MDISQLNYMLVPELRELAEQIGLKGYKRLNKQELIYKILDHQAAAGDSIKGKGSKGDDNDADDTPNGEQTKKRAQHASRSEKTTTHSDDNDEDEDEDEDEGIVVFGKLSVPKWIAPSLPRATELSIS